MFATHPGLSSCTPRACEGTWQRRPRSAGRWDLDTSAVGEGTIQICWKGLQSKIKNYFIRHIFYNKKCLILTSTHVVICKQFLTKN